MKEWMSVRIIGMWKVFKFTQCLFVRQPDTNNFHYSSGTSCLCTWTIACITREYSVSCRTTECEKHLKGRRELYQTEATLILLTGVEELKARVSKLIYHFVSSEVSSSYFSEIQWSNGYSKLTDCTEVGYISVFHAS